jgi:acyl carrier protein phosphodiesterase
MNYLAHAWLSFRQPEILVGNMISDFVKGKKRYDYPPVIQLGITLHREIDRFTDDHPEVKKAKEVFRPAYRLYSAALVDVVFDHFLATDKNEFKEGQLDFFAKETYSTLSMYTDFFPEKFERMFPFMKTQNWLYNYQFRWGIEKSLGGVVHRSKYMEESETAFRVFNEHFSMLESCYRIFFPEVKNLALDFLQKKHDLNF